MPSTGNAIGKCMKCGATIDLATHGQYCPHSPKGKK